MNKKQKPRVFRWFIGILCICGIALSGYRLLNAYQDYKNAQDVYSQLAELVQIESALSSAEAEEIDENDINATTQSEAEEAEQDTDTDSAVDTDTDAQTEALTQQDDEAAEDDNTADTAEAETSDEDETEDDETSQSETDEETDETASTIEDEALIETQTPLVQMDFSSLLEINEDIVGWISIPGTDIDYPIVIGDDNEYYTEHLITGEESSSGSIFLDYENASDFSDQNTLIYGHHMKDGSMFAELENYSDQEYYEEHSTILLYTPEGDYEIIVFAAFTRNASAIQQTFETTEEFMAFIEEAKELSDVQTDIEIDEDACIVTLITCDYSYENARYVVMGVLVTLYE